MRLEWGEGRRSLMGLGTRQLAEGRAGGERVLYGEGWDGGWGRGDREGGLVSKVKLLS